MVFVLLEGGHRSGHATFTSGQAARLVGKSAQANPEGGTKGLRLIRHANLLDAMKAKELSGLPFR